MLGAMKIARILLPGLLLLACAARGDVIIYKGTCKIAYDVVGDASTAPPPKSEAYLVINFATGEVGRLHFYTRSGQKFFSASAPFVLRVGTALLPNGRSATIMSDNVGSSSPGNYSFEFRFLRGTNTFVTLRSQPTTATTARPQALSLSWRYTAGDNTSASFFDRTYTMGIQARPTINANNAGQTVQDALNALTTAIVHQGYTPEPG
jgi:hypothetical protein